ncbi:hypothetical protein QNM97_06625 [Gordonia sp. L191]|uniref:hypothetical protein n=1 Tax=Gordonia sp. L191 TaxID=2982699 RepID=UPI0024C01E80|nr:hypothetical protein [Gordonia sp. L191]WHU48663.1 hypothetical protein QNM97_06625 [Gordonia sp. L191]
MSELDIVAVHEAGHAVASMLWDGPTVSRSALVAGNSHHAGLTEYDNDDFELRAEVITAGPVAEAMHTAGHRPTTSDLFRAFDGYGHLDYATLTASGRPIPTDVVALTLERVWPAVLDVAHELSARREVGPGTVLAALRVPRGRQCDSYISGLRTGLHSLRR